MAMLPDMLRRDRERWGMSVGEAGWRLGRDCRTYPALAGCCLPGRHGPAVPMSMLGPPMTIGWGRLGLKRREYVAIEDGQRPPSSNEYEAMCEFFGWPDARRR